MAKTSKSVDLALPAPQPGTPLFQWLTNEVRAAILDGRLRCGARLPATRELAARYLDGKVGRGTRVSAVLPEDLLHPPANGAPPRNRC